MKRSKNIIEEKLYGESPDDRVLEAAKYEMRDNKTAARKAYSKQKKALVGACACIIICMISVGISIPFWPRANSRHPDVFPYSDIEINAIEDINVYCNENLYSVNFFMVDSDYYYLRSKYAPRAICLLQECVIDNNNVKLYVFVQDDMIIEGINDNINYEYEEVFSNDIEVSYSIGEKITACFEYENKDYYLIYSGTDIAKFKQIFFIY